MSWLNSRRLHYLAGLTALMFVLFAALRGLFLLGVVARVLVHDVPLDGAASDGASAKMRAVPA